MKESVRCNWKHCAHSMAVAHSEGEGCYAGDPTDEHCKGFITYEEFEYGKEIGKDMVFEAEKGRQKDDD